MAISVLLCYAPEDESMVQHLKKHLSPLRRKGLITVWDYENISPGAEREEEILKHLDTDQIILLLISASFIDSDSCYTVQMRRAIERHERKEACVIPVILRPVIWKGPPLDKLQALPDRAEPVSRWVDKDEGFMNVADGINRVIEQWDTHSLPEPVEERRTMIANLDRLIEVVKARLEPPARAEATAKTLRELSVYIPNDVTLADLVVGWRTVAQPAAPQEDIAIERRRITCGELASIASEFATGQGSMAQAIKTWEQWAKAFEHSNDRRENTMAKTFARELEELKAFPQA